MKTYFKVIGIFILFFVGSFSNGNGSDSKALWDTLTGAQQNVLKSGKMLLVTEKVANAVWPRFHIYLLIPASPRDIEAAFWDIMDDPNYVPGCTKISINNRPAPNIVDATYYLNVSFLPQEVSQVQTKVTLLPNDIYNNTWTILSSTYSQSGSGSFLIVPHQQGSLICYTNFVIPKSSIASLLRYQAESQLKLTVKAIAQRVIYQLKAPPQHHVEQLKQLDAALGKGL